MNTATFQEVILSPHVLTLKPDQRAVPAVLPRRKHHIWAFFLVLVFIVLVIKVNTFHLVVDSPFFGIYSLLVTGYLLTRFIFAYFYEPAISPDLPPARLPKISFVTPAKNEEKHINQTLRAMMDSNYPPGLFEIIAIDDGSTDGTLERMRDAAREARKKGITLRVVCWGINRGKRMGMAEGIRQAKGDIVIFVDSDSFVEPDAALQFVKYFRDPRVAAVAGHADVFNSHTNLLTKMQAVRYFVAFKANKSAEALFGAVTCCSGCCSAYRKSALDGIVEEWLEQRFLGVRCTYGDDRSLTNLLLKRNYRALYAPDARASTVVPETWRQFLRQQLRWKKSWTRESLMACAFMWRRNPLVSISFMLSLILPLLAPIVIIRTFLWLPYALGIFPTVYLVGLVIMSIMYGLYYHIYRNDSLWIYGMLFAWIYSLLLIWQLPYAIATLRDSKWGTR